MSYAELSKPESVPTDFDPERWLVSNAQRDMGFVLAHAEDGVIWGRVENGQLGLAGKRFSQVDVSLDIRTLQQARLFGPAGEVIVWRTPEGKFLARRIADGPTPSADTIEDQQWLWGTPIGEKDAQGRFSLMERHGFMLLREGKQGLRHAPPIGHLGLKLDERVMLTVRHYIDSDPQTGLAYIADSRLLELRRVEK